LAFINVRSTDPWGIFLPHITAALMLKSGVGYLLQDYKQGFIGGNIFGLFAVGNIVGFCVKSVQKYQ